MLLKMINSFTKKRTLEEHRLYLKQIGWFALVMTALFALLYRFVMKDFTKGFFLGLAIASFIAALYYILLSRNEAMVKRHYIAAYDERNQLVLYMSSMAALVLIFMILLILVVLYAFWSITLDYMVLILLILYSLLFGFIIFKQIFIRIL